MASRLAHVAFLSSILTLVLVLLLVSASVYKAPILTSPLLYNPRQHRLPHFRQSANPRQTLGSVHFQPARTVAEDIGAETHQSQQKLEELDTMATPVNQQVKSWPQLVGLDAEEAKKKILEEHPTLLVQVVPAGSFMTMDYNLKRVRIFKDENQKVTKAPKLG